MIHVFNLDPQHGQGHARRRDRGAGAERHRRAADLPARPDGQDAGLAARPRDLARRQDDPRRAQPGRPRGDRGRRRRSRSATSRSARYPYGAAITSDGKRGLVSNEADGTVSVIDLETARQIKEITVGPHLSHPEGIAIDPKADRAYVTVTHQDLIAVIDTRKLEVERTLSVGRPEGIGTAPVDVSVTRDGCFLLSANSGEDALAVFALPNSAGRTCANPAAKRRRKGRPRAALADSILQHEGRRGVESSESAEEEAAEIYGEEPEERAEAAKQKRPARRRSSAFELVGRIPVGSYPVDVQATPPAARSSGSRPRASGWAPTPTGQPLLEEQLRRPDQHLPVPPLDRDRPVGAAQVPDRRRPAQAHPARLEADPARQRPEAAARHADHRARPGPEDQARLLHRAREPHLRPGARRRPARRRRPLAHPLRRSASRPTPTRWPGASRCSTTSTRTPRRRSTATSGPRPPRCPTT